MERERGGENDLLIANILMTLGCDIIIIMDLVSMIARSRKLSPLVLLTSLVTLPCLSLKILGGRSSKITRESHCALDNASKISLALK